LELQSICMVEHGDFGHFSLLCVQKLILLYYSTFMIKINIFPMHETSKHIDLAVYSGILAHVAIYANSLHR
jgi:hypothetical protein